MHHRNMPGHHLAIRKFGCADRTTCWSDPPTVRQIDEAQPRAQDDAVAAALPRRWAECLGRHRNQVSVQTTSATTAQNGTDIARAFAIPRAGRRK